MEGPVKWCDQHPHFQIDIKDIALVDAKFIDYKIVTINRGDFRALIHSDLSGLLQIGNHTIWYDEISSAGRSNIKILLIRKS